MADLELTVKQTALALDKSDRTVRRYLAQGRLRGRKVAAAQGGGGLEKWLIESASVRSLAADMSIGQQAPDSSGQLADELRSLRQENAEYRELLGALIGEVKELKDMLRALPPAPPRRTLWDRLLGREGASNGEEKGRADRV